MLVSLLSKSHLKYSLSPVVNYFCLLAVTGSRIIGVGIPLQFTSVLNTKRRVYGTRGIVENMKPSKEEYVPLVQDSVSEGYDQDARKKPAKWGSLYWKDIACVLLGAMNLVLLASYIWATQNRPEYMESSNSE